jgi:hypothetical protein
MLDKIKGWFGELFSTAQEQHAFLVGISEVIAFWKPRFGMPENYEAAILPGNPLYEYHYYMFGRACGVLVWIGLAKIIQVALFS